MTAQINTRVARNSRSRLDELAAACARRRRTFLCYALPLVVADFLAPALAPALLKRTPVLALTLSLLPFPILFVLTWRVFRAACPHLPIGHAHLLSLADGRAAVYCPRALWQRG